MKGYPMHIELIYTGMSQKCLFNKFDILCKISVPESIKITRSGKKEHRLTHLTPYLMTSVNPTKALY